MTCTVLPSGKASCVHIVWEMLHGLSSLNIDKIYNIHCYLLVAGDDPRWFLFSPVVPRLMDHGMSSPKEAVDLVREFQAWERLCSVISQIPASGGYLSTSIIHLRGHGYTNDPSSWGVTNGPFLSTLTWCSFRLESYSGDSLLFGISWPPAWEHWSLIPNQDLEEGVWRAPAIVPPSFPRAFMLGVRSASLMPCLFLSAPLGSSVTGCWKTNNTAPTPRQPGALSVTWNVFSFFPTTGLQINSWNSAHPPHLPLGWLR